MCISTSRACSEQMRKSKQHKSQVVACTWTPQMTQADLHLTRAQAAPGLTPSHLSLRLPMSHPRAQGEQTALWKMVSGDGVDAIDYGLDVSVCHAFLSLTLALASA